MLFKCIRPVSKVFRKAVTQSQTLIDLLLLSWFICRFIQSS